MAVVIPPKVVASWPPPNLVDPEIRGPSYVVSSSIFFSLSVIVVSTRLWYRHTKKQLWWDDLLAVLALIFTAALTIVVGFAAYRGGWRQHLWDVIYDKKTLGRSLKFAYVAYILYGIAATLSRCASLVFFYRLFGRRGGSNAWKWTLHGCVGGIVLCNLIFACLTALGCRPIKLFWTLPAPKDIREKCVDVDAIVLAFSIINVIQDLMTMLLPIPIVYKLQMPLRERIGVIVILTIGSAATISGAIKSYYIWLTFFGGQYDRTWWILTGWIAGLAEINVIIICSCASALKPLLYPFAKKTLTRMGITSGGDGTLMNSIRKVKVGSGSKHTRLGSLDGAMLERGESRAEINRGDLGKDERTVVVTRSYEVDRRG
ncbi:hypothetical protein KVT40_001267 [Elsinoe batatas]|uniref:Rhodopsin domain-containing protein n=1 Tax=Elsinoe batatas TaxID=2601811 RepID=A0A8K0LAW5_9PEZI|nr:hypothetical protein KVT40_001267 [Elsinoe batatas]